MLYLILSILFSTSLVIILRLFSKWKIHTEYGIVFNYAVCCITGLLAMDNKQQLLEIPEWNGWWICLLLGIGFILIFVLIGKSTQLLGVATTSIAFKLSFVIPVIVAVVFYGDTLTVTKIIGIITAVTAVYFITFEKDKVEDTVDELPEKRAWLLPVIILLGSGVTDSTFNFIQRNYTPPGYDHIVTILIFFGAFVSGLVLYGFKRELYQWKNVAGGIILGIPNYGSLYFLLQALKHTGYNPSTLFPVNNLGIVGLSALAGLFLFREHFSFRKIIGFVLAVISIVIIGFL
jgi:drug/metabolite transporter (DMT)-like permease